MLSSSKVFNNIIVQIHERSQLSLSTYENQFFNEKEYRFMSMSELVETPQDARSAYGAATPTYF